MNQLLGLLAEICGKYRLEEKILIVPSFSLGRELCEGLSRNCGGWVNLRPETTIGLAHQVAAERLAEDGISILPSYLAATILEEIFHDLEERKKLKYFIREGSSPSMVRAMAGAIYEIRCFGIKSGDIAEDSFVNPDKGSDFKAIFKSYELYLLDHKMIDTPGVLSLALEILRSAVKTGDDAAIYLLPSFLQLTRLEDELIKELAGDGLVFLEPEVMTYTLSVVGQPERRSAEVMTNAQRLAFLNDIGNAPPPLEDGTLDYFHAYGMNNEVREVMRRIRYENLPLDTVAVAYTNPEYISVFHSLSKRMGFGLTISEGIPVLSSAPGRLLMGLVEWTRSDFSASVLRKLFLSGDMELRTETEGDAVSPQAAARLVRVSGVGWGRERYGMLLDMARRSRDKAEMLYDEEDNERREILLRESETISQLHTLLQSVISLIPVAGDDGMVDFKTVVAGLATVVESLTRVKEDIDAAALKMITLNLRQASQYASIRLSLGEGLDRVESMLRGIGVGASGPIPGCLHLVNYHNLIWGSRPNTFVVGLDANSFPGSGWPDPVLLDSERLRIHEKLQLRSDQQRENQAAMVRSLASRRGKVVLSFPSFNVVDNRLVFPSSILLQVHRLLKGDNTLDYSDLLRSLGAPAGYCPQDGKTPLDATEMWVENMVVKRLENGDELVRKIYPGIDLGLEAAKTREAGYATEYDGKIDVNPNELDPRKNSGLVMSASAIEFLASCPYAYFLKHVLGLYPPDEVVYDPGRWLDPMERGSLLHQLFCDFMRRVSERGERVDLRKHREMMQEIAKGLIEEYRKDIPPPSQVVFDYEVEEILRCCELFLSIEEGNTVSMPVLFEAPFGLGEEEVKKAGCGVAGPIAINLDGSTKFNLRGKIDRIDYLGGELFSVWDYKTGSAYGYDDQLHLNRGRQVQHALYSVAAEAIIKDMGLVDNPRVEEAGYTFPTERGEGRRVARQQTERGPLTEVMGHLFDLLANGAMVAADDGNKCGFCDYVEVCNPEFAVGRAESLVKGNDPSLEPWRRLKNIG